MKRTIWISVLSFCLLFFSFSSVYYLSYRNLEREKELELAEGEKGNRERLYENSLENTTEAESDAVAAEKKDPVSVTKDMLYISQNYDAGTGTLTETILPVPESYLGLSREELIALLKSSGEEKSLVSFSSSRLVIRSEETVKPEDYRFLLILEEGYLKVYDSDRRDIYMETYLTEEELPESERSVLKNGYYIKGVRELYDYLESITS